MSCILAIKTKSTSLTNSSRVIRGGSGGEEGRSRPLKVISRVSARLLYKTIISSFTAKMSGLWEKCNTWLQKMSANVLRQGTLPKHVGFIMDGNRRFAKKNSLPIIEGHVKGKDKLVEIKRWCKDINITEITVFAFSIENFKRPPEEVNGLMKLCKEYLTELLQDKVKLIENGMRFQAIGDWSFVPSDVRMLLAQVMMLTKKNSEFSFNFAFAYTGRNEIARGVLSLHQGVVNGDLIPEDIDEDLLNESFQIHPTQPLDLLIRTSGESRLSDFLLWQSCETVLHFIDVLWPQFSLWNLLHAILQYQINCLHIKQFKLTSNSVDSDSDAKKRKHKFVEKMRNKEWTRIQEHSTKSFIT